MAWTNILDMPGVTWVFYVQFRSATSASPDSVAFLVPVSELSADVGTVSVTSEGEIVCDFTEWFGSTGLEVYIVAMPSGAAPEAAPFRVTATRDDVPIELLIGGGLESIASVAITGGANEYGATVGAVDDDLDDGTIITQILASGPCPSGEGLGLKVFRQGF